MYNPKMVAKLVIKNLKKFGNPLGIPKERLNNWYLNIGLRHTGKCRRIFFTGMMYQLAPYILKVRDNLYKFENTPIQNLIGCIPSQLFRLLSANGNHLKRFNGIIVNIWQLLLKSKREFCYNPKMDFYTGILLYDLGELEFFEKYAKMIVDELQRGGVEEILCIDPHTTYVLKKVYPKFTDANFEVYSYLEVVEHANVTADVNRITIHDSCYYARYLKIYKQPRKLLNDVEVFEVEHSKEKTNCCGMPLESISPRLSMEIARQRYEELRETGCTIVTFCPLCLTNLKVFGNVKDLAEIVK